MSLKAKSNVSDAEEVLDFINSLPESKSTNSGAEKDSESKNAKSTDDNEELFEFLDELAAQDKDIETDNLNKAEVPDNISQEKANVEVHEDRKNSQSEHVIEKEGSNISEQLPAAQTNTNETTSIGNILSWWGDDKASKVTSLWGSLSTGAHNLGEQTYQLASSTSSQLNQQRHKFIDESDTEQIQKLGSKFNQILQSVTQQINQGLLGETDELLNIILVNDLHNINYLEEECEEKFNWVNNQVEGGISVNVNHFNHKSGSQEKGVNLNIFYGKKIDGEKLCIANLDSAIRGYEKATRIGEKDHEKHTPDTTEIPFKQSNIFISIQAISCNTESSSNKEVEKVGNNPVIDIDGSNSFSFMFIMKDISNDVSISCTSQHFPLKWSKWLSGEKSSNVDFADITPSEWVKNWIRDGIALTFGVLAQEYVIRRMDYD